MTLIDRLPHRIRPSRRDGPINHPQFTAHIGNIQMQNAMTVLVGGYWPARPAQSPHAGDRRACNLLHLNGSLSASLIRRARRDIPPGGQTRAEPRRHTAWVRV